jgi:hypothetical protein
VVNSTAGSSVNAGREGEKVKRHQAGYGMWSGTGSLVSDDDGRSWTDGMVAGVDRWSVTCRARA